MTPLKVNVFVKISQITTVGNMEEIFYKKVGRKYVAISVYGSNFVNSVPYGDHLLSIYQGGSSRRPIMPAFAPMIAAGRYGRDSITHAIRQASDMRPQNTPVTKGQQRAWKKLAKEFDDDIHCLTWPAAQDAADAAVNAMQAEADKYLTNPAVRKAYEQFLLVVELTKETT